MLRDLSRIDDESSQGASEHYDFFQFGLSVFGKYKSNVMALVGDSSNENRAFVRLFERVTAPENGACCQILDCNTLELCPSNDAVIHRDHGAR